MTLHAKATPGKYIVGNVQLEILESWLFQPSKHTVNQRHAPELLEALCKAHRVVPIPIDVYMEVDPDKPDPTLSIVADSLAAGRYEEAITIYLDTHWSKVKELIERMHDGFRPSVDRTVKADDMLCAVIGLPSNTLRQAIIGKTVRRYRVVNKGQFNVRLLESAESAASDPGYVLAAGMATEITTQMLYAICDGGNSQIWVEVL